VDANADAVGPAEELDDEDEPAWRWFKPAGEGTRSGQQYGDRKPLSRRSTENSVTPKAPPRR